MDLAGRTLLGKYRIDGQLGQGGMGTVWRGAHVVTGRKVAIKVLDERFLSNVNVVQRFGREARAASAIQHEGIVEVLDLDQTEEGLPFLVMEFLEGETISSRIDRKKRLSQDEVVRIGVMLLEALEAAHQHGVVHRDLKPDNIYLVPAGRRGEIVKILDFGISHKDDEAQAKLTMTGSVLGTPHYMSPEQAMGETTLDRRVDIYGAGVVLYECLVGDVPFDAPNYNKLLRVILDEEPVPPSKRGAIVDERVERVILRAIEKERDKRPQTARELLEELRAAARPVSAPAPRRTASASFAKPSDVPRTPTPTPRPAAVSSAVRPREAPSSSSFDLAVGDELEGLALQPPAKPAATSAPRTPLHLDAKSGSTSLDALDDPLSASSSLSLELDESALPARAPASGQQRIIIERNASDRSGTDHRVERADPRPIERAVSERSIPAQRATASSTSTPRMAATRTSSDAVARAVAPTPPVPARSDPPSRATSTPPSKAPPAPGARERWSELSDGTRRAIVLGIVGLVLFVGIVAAVRFIVRPGEELPPGADVATGDPVVPATPDAPVARDWVLIEVDGVPPGAQLRLDGLPGATLPLRVRRGGAHVLEIRAPGYEDRRLEFTAERNLRLRADLRPAVGTTQELP
ncbi:protein kinase domain-containing protein [Sandaracinus amylolyticus]|uniref:Serine/threonine protein kinase PrkC, regulator of stationary phase n=1 Tax=Sandaracinus amylolyticus TaxID=927083 RepID=A0A0F6YI40_9BACT|nr:protein kinase [Sandaracinus amylolyticus]AKF06563.1 Serine/threonine protein kinase PrkC, regulator of stationary phase [Sandaracinus amylolyticus]